MSVIKVFFFFLIRHCYFWKGCGGAGWSRSGDERFAVQPGEPHRSGVMETGCSWGRTMCA